MSNALSTTSGVSPETLEKVLAVGDLSQLTVPQRLEYLANVCKSLGLNPLTRPIQFMSFQGKVVPYATKDCTDQLRKINGISLEIKDKQELEGLYIVTAAASDAKNRRDEDMGAVNIMGLKGEARANAILKAITKAKRRVTLSICGLGFLDETEVSDMAGAAPIEVEVVRTPATPQAPKETPLDRAKNLLSEVGAVETQDALDALSERVSKAVAYLPGIGMGELAEELGDEYRRQLQRLAGEEAAA